MEKNESAVDRWIEFQNKLNELDKKEQKRKKFYKKNNCDVPYVDTDLIDNFKQ